MIKKLLRLVRGRLTPAQIERMTTRELELTIRLRLPEMTDEELTTKLREDEIEGDFNTPYAEEWRRRFFEQEKRS